MSATLVPPVGGKTGAGPAAHEALPAPRIPRCLRLVEHANGIKFRPADQCPNERLPEADLCAKHLASAVQQYNAIVSAHTIGEAPAPFG